MPASGAVTRHRYKVVVLGAPSAGKTALVRRLADGSFVEGARPRGLDFYTCRITLRDDITVALQLWDLSDCPCSPEDDHAPLAAYVFNSQAVLFVYDVSCPSSLESLRYALRAVEAAAATAGPSGSGGARPYFALVANKADLQWTASEALARELAARHGCVRYTLSAWSGQGVSRAAVQLACDLAGVPLSAATEHSAHYFMEPDGIPLGMGPGLGLGSPADFAADPASSQLNGPAAQAPATEAAAAAFAPANACTTAKLPTGPTAAAAVAALQQWQTASGRFHARAPVYQAAARTPPQESGAGNLNNLGAYGIAGGGGGSGFCGGVGQPWQPISRSATPTRGATLISRTGPLGHIESGSPPLSPPSLAEVGRSASAKGGAAAAVASHAAREGSGTRGACAVSERSSSLSPSVSFQRQGNGWRGLLCCLPARR